MKTLIQKRKGLFSLLSAVYLLLILCFTIPIKQRAIELPGGISSIAAEIKITDKKNSEEFYSIYILDYKNPTLFQLFTARLSKETRVYKPAKTADKLAFKRGSLYEELSYQYSLITAYQKASLIDQTISIDYDLKGFTIIDNTNKDLKIADLVVKVNGQNTTTFTLSTLADYLRDKQEAQLEILRDEKLKQITITKGEDGLFGISLLPFYIINEAAPNYKTYYQDDKKVGPSGGLLQTLSIYYTLIEVEHNLIISGTGTIDEYGKVGPIGGIKQKLITANGKVDLFFCPEEHYKEAKAIYDKLSNPTFELVKVGDVDEAILYLS